MKRPGHADIVTALLLLLVGSQTAQAWYWDWLGLYPTEIEAVLRFDGTYRVSDDFDGQFDNEWQTGIRVSQRGYILDPGIAAFKVQVEPVYIWGKFDTAAEPQTLSGNNLSYALELGLLRGTPGPFSYDLSAVRTRNTNSGSLGGRYLNEAENASAAMHWKSPAFPTSLTYTERWFKQEFLSGITGFGTRRDEKTKTLTLKGRSSKLNMFAEHLSLDDRVPGRDLDYELERINLSHILPWGSGSTLRSRLDYYDRSGFNGNQRLSLDEAARIQHTATMFSQSTYRFASINQAYTTREHSGQFTLGHNLWGNLSSSAHMFGSSTRSDPVDQTLWRVGLDSDYHKGDLFGAAVRVGLGYHYGVTDRDSRQGLAEIIDEAHVTTLGGAVILNRRFIIAASVIVTSADGTLVYADGIDYTLLDLPDDLTQLQVIPGGRIEPGDTILVSYKALLLPSAEYSTSFTRIDLGIDYGWVRFTHSDRDRDENLISGMGESFLNPTRNIVSTLDFRWNMSSIEFLVGAERRFSRYTSFEATNYTLRQLVTWSAFKNSQWNLSLVESRTETTTQITDLYSLDLSVNWQPLMNLSIRPRLGFWKRIDEGELLANGKRDDQYVTAGFTLRWVYRKVAFDMAYNHNLRTTDTQQVAGARTTNEDRLVFNLTRRF